MHFVAVTLITRYVTLLISTVQMLVTFSNFIGHDIMFISQPNKQIKNEPWMTSTRPVIYYALQRGIGIDY